MNKNFKTFEDLNFKPHPHSNCGIPDFTNTTQAIIEFKNGYGVSVVFGSCFYSNGIDSYEVAILHNGSLCYNTHITNDVIGYISSDEVTEIMKKVQLLKTK